MANFSAFAVALEPIDLPSQGAKKQFAVKNSSLYKPNVLTLTDSVDFHPYMNNLLRKIKYNWKPPMGIKYKTVTLLFKVDKTGRLLSLKVLNTSGDKKMDECAINAVNLSAPFDSLPVNYKEKDVEIQFKFDYKINQ